MSTREIILRLAASTSLSMAVFAAPAWAQVPNTSSPAPAAAPSATSAQAPNNLAEVVVTARRTTENLQRVPVADIVLSGATLDRQRIQTSSVLQFSAPSLVITPDPLGGSAAPVFQLRGQTSPLGTDDTVVEYFADVPVDSRVLAGGIYDLDNVQILRGPQGTLFGKNSTGGAVVFTPRRANTLARGLAEAARGTGVTSNSIVVGITRTEPVDAIIGKMALDQGIDEAEVDRALAAEHRPTQLLHRLATSEEVANMVVYASSPQASATTGAALRVEGGGIPTAL